MQVRRGRSAVVTVALAVAAACAAIPIAVRAAPGPLAEDTGVQAPGRQDAKQDRQAFREVTIREAAEGGPLAAALERQLGLRLEPARATVDVIVVEEAVRP